MSGEKPRDDQEVQIQAGLDGEKANAHQEAQEAREKAPEMLLQHAGPCKNPEGLYVGLSQKQRETLGVKQGDRVELVDQTSGTVLGTYIVGLGSTEVIKANPNGFTANKIEGQGAMIMVRKAADNAEKVTSFDTEFGIENKDAEKAKKREEIIAKRFPEINVKEYITVPTALLNEMGVKPNEGAKGTVLPISKGQIRFAGQTQEVVFVPAGTAIGFTTEAARKLHIPSELKKMDVRVDNGVLVIN